MQITYNVKSYSNDDDTVNHAVTGDGWIAYSLFHDLLEENPDRVYSIEATTEFKDEDDSYSVTKETPEGVMELIAFIRGTKNEEDLEIVTFDNNREALDQVISELGISI
jgi:hypothetical protein